MTNRMFHVGLMFPGVPKVLDLEPDFDALGDWVRYSQTGWLIWSEKSSADILHAVMVAVDANDIIVITPVESGGFAGRLPEWMWTWVRSKLPDIETTFENPGLFANLIPPPRPKR